MKFAFYAESAEICTARLNILLEHFHCPHTPPEKKERKNERKNERKKERTKERKRTLFEVSATCVGLRLVLITVRKKRDCHYINPLTTMLAAPSLRKKIQ